MEKKAVFKIADKKNAILLGAAFIGILLVIIAGISGEMFSSLSANKYELSLDEYITCLLYTSFKRCRKYLCAVYVEHRVLAEKVIQKF